MGEAGTCATGAGASGSPGKAGADIGTAGPEWVESRTSRGVGTVSCTAGKAGASVMTSTAVGAASRTAGKAQAACRTCVGEWTSGKAGATALMQPMGVLAHLGFGCKVG